MLHHSNGPFSLNLLPAHQDLCQESGFEASLQVSHSSYLSRPSMLIEISRPTNPLPTCITPEMSPRTGTLPPFRPLIRCLTNSCLKNNQCSPRNHRQYRDSHYHFPQRKSSGPPTLCSVSDFECSLDIRYAAAVQAQIAGPRAEIALQDTLPSPFSCKHIWASDNDYQMPTPAQVPTNLSYEFLQGQDAHAKSQQVVDSAPRFNNDMHDF